MTAVILWVVMAVNTDMFPVAPFILDITCLGPGLYKWGWRFGVVGVPGLLKP